MRIGCWLIVAIATAAYAGSLSDSQAQGASDRVVASPCSASKVTVTVRELLRFYNAGDVRQAGGLVAQEPAFQWFSAPGPTRASRRLGASSKVRGTLDAYFRERHSHHERLTLTKLEVTNQGQGNFALHLVRAADDFPRRAIEGKGAVSCGAAGSKVIVWSLGG